MKTWLNLYGFLCSKSWYVMKYWRAGELAEADTPTLQTLVSTARMKSLYQAICPAEPLVVKCPFQGHLGSCMQVLNTKSFHTWHWSFLPSQVILPCLFLFQGQAESMGNIMAATGCEMCHQLGFFPLKLEERAWLECGREAAGKMIY